MEMLSKVSSTSLTRSNRFFRKTPRPWMGCVRRRCFHKRPGAHILPTAQTQNGLVTTGGDTRHTNTSHVDQVESSDSEGHDDIDVIRHFKANFFDAEKPLHVKSADFLPSRSALPAMDKWFESEPNTKGPGLRDEDKVMTPYLRSFSSELILPFELAYPQHSDLLGDTIQNFLESLNVDKAMDPAAALRWLIKVEQSREDRVLRFVAPLALLEAAQKFNFGRSEARLRSLYIAQALISDLPKELQDDLPVPRIVKLPGRGDIYGSSIWLGLEPTFTPLHRDPNPNLFIQMCSHKIIRLLPPTSGDRLYREVQNMLPQTQRGNPRLRGLEMMHGPERDLLRKAVWDEQGLRSALSPESVAAATQGSVTGMMQEAHLAPGDALFIPKGWWHSVKSRDGNGALNASVNWWFR